MSTRIQQSHSKKPSRISSAFKAKIPSLKIGLFDRIWMAAAYEQIKKNQKLDFRVLRIELDDRLPLGFDPANISYHLMNGNGEYISILGILALEKTTRIFTACNQVMQAIRAIIKSDPKVKQIEASTISQMTGLLQDTVEVLLQLIYPYARFAVSMGNYKLDTYGFGYFSIDPAAFTVIIKWTNIQDAIIQSFSSSVSNDGFIIQTSPIPQTEKEWKRLIIKGETSTIEFKRQFRVPVSGEQNKYLEHSVMKTIAAFLNSEGGHLLLGIDDNKQIIGLDADFNTFPGEDKQDAFSKHFDNITGTLFGSRYSRYWRLSFIEIEGKIVCDIFVKAKAAEPVTIPDERKIKQFYIRRTASTIALDTADAIKYTGEHWSKAWSKHLTGNIFDPL